MPGMAERTIIINGFSKSYAMTGWRLAWLAAPLPVAKLARTYQTQTVTSAASFSMVAGAAALNGPQDCVHEMVAAYAQRRKFLIDALVEIPGVSSSPIEGAFYLFAQFTETDKKSLEISQILLEDGLLASTPGHCLWRSRRRLRTFQFRHRDDRSRENSRTSSPYCAGSVSANMDISLLQYLLAIVAGIVAGIINTLAGSGSAVTLPMLVFLGLDAGAANATNRIGVIIQNVVGITTFARSGRMQLRGGDTAKQQQENILDADSLRFGLWLSAAGMPGALIGAYVATLLDKDAMNLAIGGMLIIVLVTIFFNPTKWLREKSEVRKERPELFVLVLFFAIGIYGGFIQAGVGVFLVTALVLGVGYTIVHANAVKLIFVLALNIVAFAVFVLSPLEIDWGIGALMAVGQSIGAWAAVRFAVTVKDANRWVRYLLIVVVIYSILRFFGLLDLFFALF